MSDEYTPEEMRELGKQLYFGSKGDRDTRSRGIDYIIKAHMQGDAEASFIVAKMFIGRALSAKDRDPDEEAARILCSIADDGYIPARILLNSICYEKYKEKTGNENLLPIDGPLVDFDGKPIKINRGGVFAPVDAKLEYSGGKNIFTLSANIMFIEDDCVANEKQLINTVLEGIREWQGEYEVFGGQKVTVKINLETNDKLIDSVLVLVCGDELSTTIEKYACKFSPKKSDRIKSIIGSKRSFAAGGIIKPWSVYSRKTIFLMSHKKDFSDYDEIKDVVKHEFGHVIGLGDLYCEEGELDGVEKGTYRELDGFYVYDKFYNLVMCDHHGPISNNDIEMVLLAFRDNEMQLYQPMKIKGKLSKALGKGN